MQRHAPGARRDAASSLGELRRAHQAGLHRDFSEVRGGDGLLAQFAGEACLGDMAGNEVAQMRIPNRPDPKTARLERSRRIASTCTGASCWPKQVCSTAVTRPRIGTARVTCRIDSEK